ncbi:DUF397 domain-containing protein [Nocardia jejuensis]|uniref:DUF397 domain-containing protein n=1 Tax=Nocardia jejuensis TaxID=328049 RepID=UPI0008333398|nr:DUF397 domain-containing protein [Nocardia jejuensis]
MKPSVSEAEWFKSSRSASSGGECVEAAHLAEGAVGVRDSTQGSTGPVLVFAPAAWDLFTDALKAGTFDRPLR